MKIFKTKWEKMFLKLIESSFNGVKLYKLSKDDIKSKSYEETIKSLILDAGIVNDDYYQIFCYTISKDGKHETMLINNFKGSKIYSNIQSNVELSDAIQLMINKVKPEFFEHLEKDNYLCLGDGHFIKPAIADFIVIKPE